MKKATATQRLRPRSLWVYDITYSDIQDIRTRGEFGAKRLNTRLNSDELEYFLKSPGIVIHYCQLDYCTLFF